MTKPAIDPVQLEIIRNALIAAAEEMSVTIWRTSRSTVVREMLDYSTQVFDGKGRAVVESIGLPLDEDMEDFLSEAREDVAAALKRLKGGQRHDREAVTEAARLAARRAATRWSGKKPQVRVILAEH